MLMFVWFWSVAAAMTPSAPTFTTLPTTQSQAQTRTVEVRTVARTPAKRAALPPIMTLGWVDEFDAPIF